MDASGHHQAQVARPRPKTPVPYEYEAAWAPETPDVEGDKNTAGLLSDSNPAPSSL